MKRYIQSDTDTGMTSKQFLKAICKLLNEHGIDTTLHNYKLIAEGYERYGGGRTYTVQFKCPGNYLAYISMILHTDIKHLDNLVEYFEDWGIDITNYQTEFFNNFPNSLEGMESRASSNWWGDGDDYIISLVNLDTGETLYEGDGGYDEYYDEDDSDYDDWED